MSQYHSRYGSGYQRKKKKSPFVRFLQRLLVLIVLAAAVAGYFGYRAIFNNNVWIPNKTEAFINIPTGADYQTVCNILYSQGIIIHRKSFEFIANKKGYPRQVKAGRYRITPGTNNNELINLLRSGEQTAVDMVFHNIRTKEQLAGVLDKQLETDSTSIINLLNDSVFLKKYDLTPATAVTIFIPNTYKVYWNTSSEKLIDRMHQEYNKFWNESRKTQAKLTKLSIEEIVTLASIVEKESNHNDEKPTIAGVYINRLRRAWRLQADPTLVFALGDFNIKRVLNVYKEIDSPYNTYKHTGLPPGPICIPSIASVDAVLNYEDHQYLYFCAKDDMSGYHVFAQNDKEHINNAKKYRAALDKMNIRK